MSETEALTLTVPVEHTQRAQLLLEPFALHDAALGGVEALEAGRRLTLHPRLRSLDALPEALRQDCAALGGRWGTRSLGLLSPATHARLFTVLFFSGSKPIPALAPGLPPTWRRVLSNFHRAELRLAGATYASVEHWFQAEKARCSTRPEMQRWFESGCRAAEAVGDDPAAAKQAGGRRAYARAGASLDGEAWLARRVPAMREALEARWEQQPLFRAVLESTAGVSLLHFERSGARSFWGGSLGRDDGLPRGENQLGVLLMRMRDGV